MNIDENFQNFCSIGPRISRTMLVKYGQAYAASNEGNVQEEGEEEEEEEEEKEKEVTEKKNVNYACRMISLTRTQFFHCLALRTWHMSDGHRFLQ